MELAGLSSWSLFICFIPILVPYSAIHLASAAAVQPNSAPLQSNVNVDNTSTFSNHSSESSLNLSEVQDQKPKRVNDKRVLVIDSKGGQENAVVRIVIPNFIVCDPSQPGVCKDDLLEICRQVNGMYRCLCPENISRTSQGKCTVFNECFEKVANNCSQEAECLDQEEGYTCRCKDGFRDQSPNPNLPGRLCVAGGQRAPEAPVAPVPLGNSEPVAPPAEATNAPPPTEGQTKFDEKNVPGGVGESRDPSSNRDDEKHSLNFGDTQAHALAAASLLAFQSQSKDEEPNASTPSVSSSSSNGDDQTVDTQPRPPVFGENTLREVFRSFDLDRNDLIAFWEVKSAVELYQLNIEEKDIRKMIKLADVSGEGLVDFGEFAAIMTTRFK